MSPTHLHILIIEPSVIIYRGLAAVLTDKDSRCVIDHLSDCENIERFLSRNRTNLVIMNPVFLMSGYERFKEIKANNPDAKFLGFVYAVFDPQILAFFDGVVSVTDLPGSILNFIRQALEMKAVDQKGEEPESLSNRENEVLKLLVEGSSNKEIADRLSISVNTVVTHRKNISHKTGIKSVSGLTIFAIVKGIISIETGAK